MLTLALVTGGRDNVLPKLATHPSWMRTTFKNTSVAADLLLHIAQQAASAELQAMVRDDIDAALNEYTAKNGARPVDAFDEWDAGIDDVVEKLFEPHDKYLSANWLGTNTIDTRLHEPGAVDALAKSFAAEVWLQLTYSRSTNQILAGVGIVGADLDAVAGQPTGTTTDEHVGQPPEYNPMAVNEILNRIILTFPDDEAQLREDLDFATGDDEGLAVGGMGRLCITADDASVLMEARKRSTAALDAWVNAIMAGEMLDEAKVYADLSGPAPSGAVATPADPLAVSDPLAIPPGLRREPPAPPQGRAAAPPPPPPAPAAGAVPPPPPAAAGAPPPPPPPPPAVTTGEAPAKRKRGAAAAAPSPTAIPAAQLVALKQAMGMKDDELAGVFGVARPTFNNMVNGRTECDPSADRRAALKQVVYERIAKMTDVYNTL